MPKSIPNTCAFSLELNIKLGEIMIRTNPSFSKNVILFFFFYNVEFSPETTTKYPFPLFKSYGIFRQESPSSQIRLP